MPDTGTTGLRTVLVAFALKGIQRASKHSCDQLLTLGFPLPNPPNSPTCTSTLKHQPCSEGQNQLQDTSGVHADGRDGGRGLSVVDSPPTFQALPDASKVTVDGQDGGRVHSLVNAHCTPLEPNQANHVQAVYVHVHTHSMSNLKAAESQQGGDLVSSNPLKNQNPSKNQEQARYLQTAQEGKRQETTAQEEEDSQGRFSPGGDGSNREGKKGQEPGEFFKRELMMACALAV